MQPEYDVIIAGGGPAGAAAAIQLAAADAGVASRSLLLDRARFPRPKLCGGGVVRQADQLLALLRVHIDVPSVPIHTIRFEHPEGSELRSEPNAFRVVRRDEFDAALLRHAIARGVEVRQGERIVEVLRQRDCVRLVTDAREYTCRIVIGADGARSLIRRRLVAGTPRRFVALEITTRAADVGAPASHTAVFDFRPAGRGVHGYYWDFPCVRDGVPCAVRGLGGAAWPQDETLKDIFDAHQRARGVEDGATRVEGATIPIYDPHLPQSAERVLLAGDAVGVDPWLGEGISSAIGTGMLAAHAAIAGLRAGDFRFDRHRGYIRNSAVGWQLRRNRATARSFYRALARTWNGAPPRAHEVTA